MNKKMFYAEIEDFKKKCINKLILSAVFSTLIIVLLLANIIDSTSTVRGFLFMGVVVTIACYFGIIYSVISNYTDKFVELSKKYNW